LSVSDLKNSDKRLIQSSYFSLSAPLLRIAGTAAVVSHELPPETGLSRCQLMVMIDPLLWSCLMCLFIRENGTVSRFWLFPSSMCPISYPCTAGNFPETDLMSLDSSSVLLGCFHPIP